MKKFAVTLGIAVAILVSAFGIGIVTAMANNAVINKEEDVTIDVLDLIYDDIEAGNLFTDYDRAEIDRVEYNVSSGKIEHVDYSVYDRDDCYLGGGCVDWDSLVTYIK